MIGLVGGPLFALYWRSLRVNRRQDFARDADELRRALRSHFAADGRR